MNEARTVGWQFKKSTGGAFFRCANHPPEIYAGWTPISKATRGNFTFRHFPFCDICGIDIRREK